MYSTKMLMPQDPNLPDVKVVDIVYHRPEEAMLFVVMNICLHMKIILHLRALKDYFLLIHKQAAICRY